MAERLIFGTEHLPLSLVELGSRVTLGVLNGLLADVIGGHLCRVRATHLQEKTEHPVESHLQRTNARALDFFCLVASDPGLAARGQFNKPIISSVETCADKPTIPGEERTAFAERLANLLRQIRAWIKPVSQRSQETGC